MIERGLARGNPNIPYNKHIIVRNISGLLRKREIEPPNSETNSDRDEIDALEDEINRLGVNSGNESSLFSKILENFERKKPRVHTHCMKTAEIARWIGIEMGLGEDEIKKLYVGAFIHDIGKLFVNDEVLNKPGPLDTFEEVRQIERHSRFGFYIAIRLGLPLDVCVVALQHHWNEDESNIPSSHLRDEILNPQSKLSKIVKVADSFKVMTSERTYNSPLSWIDAFKELKRCSGTQFNPEAVDACINMHTQIYGVDPLIFPQARGDLGNKGYDSKISPKEDNEGVLFSNN